jgi:hypothetical protein
MFSEIHPDHKSHLQQICKLEKRLIPVPIGPAFPRRDCEDDMSRYHRLMLILFKPWCSPSDLIDVTEEKNIETALKNSFNTMVEKSPSLQKYLANMQALHECKDSRDDHFQSRANERQRKTGMTCQQNDREEISDDFVFGNPDDIGDEILEHLNDTDNAQLNTNHNTFSDAMACVHAQSMEECLKQMNTIL